MKLILIVLLLVACVFSGCGGGGDYSSVSGSVTLDDKPLAAGTISFESKKRLCMARIVDGRYEFTAADGPLPGKQTVRITANRKSDEELPKEVKTPENPYDGESTLGRELKEEQYLPARYNTGSTLKAEVSSGSNGDVDFALESGKPAS